MTTPVPFGLFASELLPAERIEWTGQPNPKVIFHQEDLLAIPFSLMWGGVAIFWLSQSRQRCRRCDSILYYRCRLWRLPAKPERHRPYGAK